MAQRRALVISAIVAAVLIVAGAIVLLTGPFDADTLSWFGNDPLPSDVVIGDARTVTALSLIGTGCLVMSFCGGVAFARRHPPRWTECESERRQRRNSSEANRRLVRQD